MPGSDHFVIYKFFLRAEVAGEALLGAPDEVPRVIHPGRDGLFVRPGARRVRAKPSGRGAVAALAAHAFAQIEGSGAHLGRNVERMACETFCGLLGFAKAQDFPHALANRPGQRVVGFRVFIFHGPDAVFVLKNAAVGARCDAAVATCRTTGAGTGVLAGVRGRPRSAWRMRRNKKNRAQANRGAS